nr:tubulin-specific chaperone A isoform X2 [Agelaius phoeniceus]XP_054508720.1 tubulin-specific chaperone A isoform X2 [Agelaius phoeniceus]
MYEKEAKQQEEKIEKMKAEACDDYGIKKQIEILQESRMMIPDCQRRLEVAHAELTQLLALQTQLSACPERKVLQLSDHLCGLLWTPSSRSLSFLCWEPRADAALQVGSQQGRAEGQNPLPGPAAHPALDAAQDTCGSLGWECPWLGHVQPQPPAPPIPSGQGCWDLFIPSLCWYQGCSDPRAASCTMALLKHMNFSMGPLLKLVQFLWIASHFSVASAELLNLSS